MLQPSKHYYVAHVRGPNYDQLRKLGFLVLYPDVDDYVFLEATKENNKLLKKQLQLCIWFLKRKGQFATVTEEEVLAMTKKTPAQTLCPDQEVEVINGYCENLEGRVLEVLGDQLKVLLQGYNRTYEVLVDRLDVIAKGTEELIDDAVLA